MTSDLNFSEYKNIFDFYQKTGMTREQTYIFLKQQLEENFLKNKIREKGKNDNINGFYNKC